MGPLFRFGFIVALFSTIALGEDDDDDDSSEPEVDYFEQKENITLLKETKDQASDDPDIAKKIDFRRIMYDPSQPSLVCSARGAGCSLKRRSFTSASIPIPISETGGILLKDAVNTRALLRESLGASANLIQIGAHTLDEQEVKYYSQLLNQGAWNLTFLEPQAKLQEKLRANVARLSKPERVTVMNKALCPIALDTLEMWKVPDTFAPGAYDWSRMASLDPAWLTHIEWHNVDLAHFFEEKTPEELVEMQEAEEVECITVRGLIADLDYEDASSWDVIIIDAQGGDTKILSMFMEIDGFAPAAIMFKWIGFDYLEEDDDETGYESELTRMMKMLKVLAQSGYDVYKHEYTITAINRKSI